MIELTPQLRKKAHFLTEQFLQAEKELAKVNQQILEKAKKINNVIHIDQLSSLKEVIGYEGEKISQV